MIYNKKYECLLDSSLEDDIFNKITNSKFLITGCTGMIGSYLVDLLIRSNELTKSKIEIYALGRSEEKAKKRFDKKFYNPNFHFIQQDVMYPLNQNIDFDYIVHAASNANPNLYSEKPVETLLGNVLGMSNLLEYTKEHSTKRIVFVSSGEVYGKASKNMTGFNEDFVGYVDYSSPRSCYPVGKRAAEVLCQSYISEYGTEAIIVRPCHTYGPTMLPSDNRAISSFIRNGVKKENIILKSKGDQIRSHCMVSDSVVGILYALIYGKNGEAYNISADNSTYSILEMAKMISNISNQKLKVELPTNQEIKGFSKVPVAILNNDKLKSLGWQSRYSLFDGLAETITILSES